MNQVDVTKLGLRYRKPKRKPSGLKSALKRDTEKEKQNMNLLWSCHNDYMQLAEKRREHLRFMRYYGGDQWGDLVDDPDNKGKKITERELFSRTGITPITHNVLQQYIRNVSGQLLTNNYKTIINARREEDAQAAEMLTNAVQACLEVNEVSSICSPLTANVWFVVDLIRENKCKIIEYINRLSFVISKTLYLSRTSL